MYVCILILLAFSLKHFQFWCLYHIIVTISEANLKGKGLYLGEVMLTQFPSVPGTILIKKKGGCIYHSPFGYFFFINHVLHIKVCYTNCMKYIKNRIITDIFFFCSNTKIISSPLEILSNLPCIYLTYNFP